MKNRSKWTAASLALFCFVWGLSQTLQPDPVSIRQQFQEAREIYLQSYKAASGAEEAALNRKALHRFKALLPKIPTTPGRYDSIFLYTHTLIGELEHYFENVSDALAHYEQAISLQNRSTLPDSLYFKPLLYAGIIHYHQNRIDKAARHFLRAETIQSKYTAPLDESQRLYNTLGVIHYETGNYRQAKNYFQKALDLLSPSNPSYVDLFVNYQINLAQIHFKLQEYDEATRIYQTLLPFGKNLDEIHHNLGLISVHLGAARSALAHFRNVRFDDERKIRLYNNIGRAYLVLRSPDEARFYLTAAREDSNAHADPIGLGMVLKSLGDLDMLTGHPQKALQHYTEAIHQFYPAYTDTGVTKNPTIFSGYFSYISLFETLVAKASAAHLLYQKEKQLSWAKEELAAYQSAFRLMAYVERTYNSDEARLFINQSKYAVHAQPIDIAFELYTRTGETLYVQTLYELDQQNKASVLALNQYLYEYPPETDTSFFQQEKKLRTAITRSSLQASLAKDSSRVAFFHRTLRDLEIQLAALQNQKENPSVTTTNIPTLRQLQEHLLDGTTALVSYHLSEERLTTIVVTSDSLTCTQKPLPPEFHARLQGYIRGIRTPDSGPLSLDGRTFYQFLLPAALEKKITRLLIIPDDELLYLPFETLQDPKGNFLATQFTIQYQYATSLLKRQKPAFSREATLALAPFIKEPWQINRDTFSPLPNSLNEIQNNGGKIILHAAATKKAFLQNLPHHTVLHLATHARAGNGPGESFIAFYPEKDSGNASLLYAEEIYHLPLHKTQLAILSACETGTGNLVRGEGIMSLSRAFRYAGCPNIITSLWKADDFSTAWLIQKTIAYLEKGSTVSSALQQAKMDYLADAGIHPRLKHPFYWAHLVFVGNLETQPSSRFLYAATGLSLFVLLLFYFWRKRKQKRG